MPATDACRKIHLGCGSVVVDGWMNIDSSPGIWLARAPRLRRVLRAAGVLTEQQATAVFPQGIVRADLRRGIPCSDATAEAVYSSHLIEHLSRWQALALLRECHRVLKPGGTLRIATPDLGELARSYLAAGNGAASADRFMEQLMTFHEIPGTLPQRLIRRLVTAPHQWLYDEESLKALFREAGFSSPSRRAYRAGDLPDLDLIEHRDDSLIIEASR